jgi:hypothetical protein
MDDEQKEHWEQAQRAARKLNADFERLCKEANFSDEQRQQLLERLEMDGLVVDEHSRRIGALLASEDARDKRVAILEVIDLVRGEILAMITPLVETLHQRLSDLENIVLENAAEK